MEKYILQSNLSHKGRSDVFLLKTREKLSFFSFPKLCAKIGIVNGIAISMSVMGVEDRLPISNCK